MGGRVVLFGATGYTGRLAALAMTRAGLAPVLAGRSADALVELVAELAAYAEIDAAPTWQAADASDPASVRALVRGPDDVLVTTVGPFARLGRAAVDAAVDAGCAYVDSTGEAAFIRDLVTVDGPRAERTGARLLPAFGYDYVPGNLAAALAVADASASPGGAAGIEVGYFVEGRISLSSGTLASIAAMSADALIGFRRGRLVDDAPRGTATFTIDGRRRGSMAVGASEHLFVPRLDRRIRDVHVYLGWAGPWSPAVNIVATASGWLTRLPGAAALIDAAVAQPLGRITGAGPDAQARAGSRTLVVARALDAVGREITRVRLDGPNPYDLTGELLAWAAAMLVRRRATRAGALGPVDAFGLDALAHGCALIGLRAA